MKTIFTALALLISVQASAQNSIICKTDDGSRQVVLTRHGQNQFYATIFVADAYGKLGPLGNDKPIGPYMAAENKQLENAVLKLDENSPDRALAFGVHNETFGAILSFMIDRNSALSKMYYARGGDNRGGILYCHNLRSYKALLEK
ncbi:MAG TPA: hypothetical protein VN132_15900 [Bdellovibrio sp.]|nr:hypothetical protein [Bdellovibrio sp.]